MMTEKQGNSPSVSPITSQSMHQNLDQAGQQTREVKREAILTKIIVTKLFMRLAM